MGFSTRRGRPRKTQSLKDTGTPELAAKFHAGLTVEPLDLCLKRGLISKDEHWAGIHFRWLYTLCFGAPGISALDIAYLKGRSLKPENIAWQEAREREYVEAIVFLRESGCKSLVMNVCLFNQRPGFLSIKPTLLLDQRYGEYAEFKQALAGLYKVFKS